MKQLNKKAVWLFFIYNLFGGLVFIIFFAVFTGSFLNSFIINGKIIGFFSVSSFLFNFTALAVLYIVLCFIVAKLSYRYYKYELTDITFRKEQGIIWKKYVSIPYDRIQNVDIYRSLWARLLGLSDIHIHTAGVGGVAMGEGRLPGLTREAAEQMREEIIMRSRNSRLGQGL